MTRGPSLEGILQDVSFPAGTRRMNTIHPKIARAVQAENSCEGLRTQNSASVDKVNEVDSVVVTANTYSVLPKGLRVKHLLYMN